MAGHSGRRGSALIGRQPCLPGPLANDPDHRARSQGSEDVTFARKPATARKMAAHPPRRTLTQVVSLHRQSQSPKPASEAACDSRPAA
ncbi:MAG: hypothetical protein IOD01_00185 [Rhodobacter sp.]|nr:hypothetical protein [Rhodobacter sp.]